MIRGMPFDAVLCDVDGVLRRWPPLDELDLAHGLPAGTLAGAAFAPARLLPAITGACTDEQWRAAVAADLAAVTDAAAALVAAWTTGIGEVDADVAALLAVARSRVPVVLVSNATTRLESDLDSLGITSKVDAIVNSARLGFAKPDPRIYRVAAKRAGVAVDRCLFIDDTLANTDAAHALGMTVLHYQHPRQLRALL